MKTVLSLLGNKYLLWALIVVAVGSFIKISSCQKSDYEERLATYERQLNGQLSDKERDLQELNTTLGLARSELVTKEELAKRLAREKEEISKEFQAFIKKHELEIQSKDETIARLQQQINGGSSDTDIIGCDELKDKITACTIVYNWKDTYGRFVLKDPNIFEQSNEIFTSDQLFKVYGEIWKQKNGSLQTRRLVLREVRQIGEGKYEEIPGAKADIIDSEFTYTDEPLDPGKFTWKDLFRLRAVALGSVVAFPDSGDTSFGFGLEFMNYKGFGLNTHLAFDFKQFLDSEWRLGIGYQPTIFGKKLNFAAGVGVGTPFNDFFKDYSVSANLIFYLHE